MTRKFLFISLAGLIVSFFLFSGILTAATSAAIPTQNANQDELGSLEKQSIVSATIHIILHRERIYESSEDSDSSQQDESGRAYLAATTRGIGTVVNYGSHILIVTHDHWEWMDEELDRVELRNADNELLMDMSGGAFRNIIRYRDGGTLILEAPGILQSAGIVPANLAPENKVVAGSRVYVAYRPLANRNQLDLRPVVVESIENNAGRSILNLRSLDGEGFVVGDSGGGAWFEGQLVGNLWMSVTVASVVQEKWFWGTRERTETTADTSIAARFPLGNQELASTLVIDTASESIDQ